MGQQDFLKCKYFDKSTFYKDKTSISCLWLNKKLTVILKMKEEQKKNNDKIW